MAQQRKSRGLAPAQRSEPAASRAWWIGEGDEECPHCEQTYVYEVETRCTRCDGPICLHCVTRSRKAVLCPDCAGGGR